MGRLLPLRMALLKRAGQARMQSQPKPPAQGLHPEQRSSAGLSGPRWCSTKGLRTLADPVMM